MTDFLQELAWRGMQQDVTPGFADRLSKGPVTGYVGFDPTARSLQIGNLVPVMLLAHLQRAGGTPIVLVGAGTAMIGDPSGKSAERPLLTLDEIDANAERQRVQLSRFLNFESAPNAAQMRNNADWLRGLTQVDFLRDIGKHFTLSYMLQKESVKSRLDSGISYTEFTYMLLQAYDYLHLHRHEGCDLQMGGSDQWGNITAGVELIRRADAAEAHALSAPLVTTASGAKFGKTEGGAIWLDPEMTSPYKFYQFWLNADDRDVIAWLKTFTFLDLETITGLEDTLASDPGARDAQRALAQDLTDRIHGPDVRASVEQAAAAMFGNSDLDTIEANVWSILETEIDTAPLNRGDLPISIVDLAARSGLVQSKGEARRQLQQGGVRVNGNRATADTTVSADDLLGGRYVWLRRGKKRDVIVRAE